MDIWLFRLVVGVQNFLPTTLDMVLALCSNRPSFNATPKYRCGCCAGVAQVVELLICNQQVGGSNPSASCVMMNGVKERVNRNGGVPEWPKGVDCKSTGCRLRRFESSPLHH